MEVLNFLLVGAYRHCHIDVTNAHALSAIRSTRLLLILMRSCLVFASAACSFSWVLGAGTVNFCMTLCAGHLPCQALCWALSGHFPQALQPTGGRFCGR